MRKIGHLAADSISMKSAENIRFTMVLLLLMTGASSRPSSGEDWPHWRGAGYDGISGETDWNPYALEETARVLWKTNIGKGHSAAIVEKGCVFISGNFLHAQDSDTSYRDHVFCLDAETGDEIWRFTHPSKPGGYPGPIPTPAVDPSSVVVLSRWGTLFRLDRRDGSVIWQREVLGDSLRKKYNLLFYGSPIVLEGRVITNSGLYGMAFDIETGDRIWGVESVRYGSATPLPFRHRGDSAVLIAADTATYAVRAENGEIFWSYPWESLTDPMLSKNQIILSGYRKKWGSAMISLEGGMPRTIWKSRAFYGVFQTGVILGGHAYGFGYRKAQYQTLQCVDIDNGNLVWEKPFQEWGSLTAAGKYLIVLDNDGNLVVVEAAAEGYRETSRAHVLSLPEELHDSVHARYFCWTAPVLANGRIYARSTSGDLVCVDMRL